MPELTILYDGGCPLCLREVQMLRRRDSALHRGEARLAFIDIDAADYDASIYGGIDYREAMGRIHAIEASGGVLRDVAVFRRAYGLVGLGWLYAPTDWPLLRPVVNALYGLWAAWRLRLTRRPGLDQLCAMRCSPSQQEWVDGNAADPVPEWDASLHGSGSAVAIPSRRVDNPSLPLRS